MADSQLPRARRILTGIDSSTWEHPADRAALMALRRIPAFDMVLKKVFGLFGEKPIRLAFQSNAVRVSEKQFPWIWERYVEVCETLDTPRCDLFVSQTPLVNAGAYGMEKPFIVLNSGAIRLLDQEELTYLLGHEVGHVMSGHVLYRTMTVLLLQLAQMGFPVVGLAARAVLVGLLEWNRKAELSSDRAGLLAVQNPEATLKGFMKMAGGGYDEETDLNEFLVQAEEYRTSGDAADLVFKVLNLLGTTHPFHVLRAGEVRDWIEAGEYDRILRGEYRRRGDAFEPWREDVAEAARSYREDAQDLARQFGEALRSAREKFSEQFRASP
ncbi:MAG: M48 family metallopeptidase [Longimicrobiales bacterium]